MSCENDKHLDKRMDQAQARNDSDYEPNDGKIVNRVQARLNLAHTREKKHT